jgi:hypothetical protein
LEIRRVQLGADGQDEALGEAVLIAQALDLGDRLDQGDELLVLGRHLLAAALVVDLGAVVVGRVVRRGDVEPTLGAVQPDAEGELGRGEVGAGVSGQDAHGDAVRGVDARGLLGEVPGREAQHGVRHPGGGVPAGVEVTPDVIGDDDGERALPKSLAQVDAVALNRRAQGPGVDAVGADADGPTATARAEGDDLVERVEEQLPAPGVGQGVNHREGLGGRGVGEPTL